MNDGLVDSRELARRLGVSQKVVWRLARMSEIPYVRVSRKCYRFDPNKVIAVLEQEQGVKTLFR
jgi:excisionase family DNA binding protein